MTETSTPTNRQRNEILESYGSDGLTAEEEQFFSTVKKSLDIIVFEPSSKSVENLLTYSKSL